MMVSSDRPAGKPQTGRQPLGRLRREALAAAFASPLYRLTFRRRRPVEALLCVPTDSWPGDATAGTQIVEGTYHFGGDLLQTAEPVWQPVNASPAWLRGMHGFEWLYDLRRLGGDTARRQARRLVEDWIHRNRRWHPIAWDPAVVGQRIASWMALHDFYLATAEPGFRARVFASIGRQAAHLSRALASAPAGAGLLSAARGLLYAGICLPGHERLAAQGLRLLLRELPKQILPDGGHVSRCPQVAAEVLRLLIDMRLCLKLGRREVPEALHHAIDRLAPAVRFFRHGDGALALFNGGQETAGLPVDTVLAQADARGKPLRSAPHSGFERLVAGRTVILMDTGKPPADAYAERAHAGTLSFELSVGAQRMIVNCGAHPGDSSAWRRALASTAAHSTLVVDDTNSSEVFADGWLGRRPARIGVERQDTGSAVLIDATHDGWQETHRLIHRRRLFLHEGGNDLRGQDILTGQRGIPFTVRFHLHPGVQASVVRSNAAVLLRLGKVGWRFVAGGAAESLELSESVYFGQGDEGRRSQQIVLKGVTEGDTTTVKWALRRERTDKARAEAQAAETLTVQS